MSGVVFHHISEGIMAQRLKWDISEARDTLSAMVPAVKNGNILAADYVLKHFDFNVKNGWGGAYAYGTPIWGTVEQQGRNTLALLRKGKQKRGTMPDVRGMGARDAVYLLESSGIKVKLSGRGKVVEQSIPAGNTIKHGMVCGLKLS